MRRKRILLIKIDCSCLGYVGLTKTSPKLRRHYSPLRYPGGKGRLAPFVQTLFEGNNLVDGHYVEPYAGGAAVALSLLLLEYASHVYINDIGKSVCLFWKALLEDTDALCRKIGDKQVTPQEWRRQRNILFHSRDHSRLSVAFAFFFLNRTNGIIKTRRSATLSRQIRRIFEAVEGGRINSDEAMLQMVNILDPDSAGAVPSEVIEGLKKEVEAARKNARTELLPNPAKKNRKSHPRGEEHPIVREIALRPHRLRIQRRGGQIRIEKIP